MNGILVSILWLAPGSALQLIAHEGSHAIAAKALGHEITRAKLYPSKDINDTWTMGYIVSSGRKLSEHESAWLAAAPLVADAILATIASAIISTKSPTWLKSIAKTQLALTMCDSSVILGGAITGKGDGAKILAGIVW
jgi:hypothetical protein